jgi:MFS family permease
MNLWKVEIAHLFRGWRGWTLAALYFLAFILAILIGTLIDRVEGNARVSYDSAIEYFLMCGGIAGFLFIGLIVSSLSFDSNKNLAIFLRLRFSLKEILVTKAIVYLVITNVLFIVCFALTFVLASILFDTSDPISVKWFLLGFLFNGVTSIFWVALVLFTSAVFKSTVASILLTLAVILGFPVFVGVATPIELLARGMIQTPPEEWVDVSYVQKVNKWWPQNLSETDAFYTVTESDIAADKITVNFQEIELDPWFKSEALFMSLLTSPLLMLYAWRTYSRREF